MTTELPRSDVMTIPQVKAAYLTAVVKHDGLSPDAADRLIASHERLRSDVAAAVDLLIRSYFSGIKPSWQSGETEKEASSAINDFMSNRCGPTWITDEMEQRGISR